mmetsp:Transcript_115199/g.372314  ORF Transcript_115199/g.372314 Transcript_115199/m.372314 type:complete len:354 (+) Transcript_115199:287-1348(+)
MAVKRLLQPQLVEVVTNEADGAAEHEQAVKATKSHQVVALLAREGTAGADHVDKRDGDAAVYVQDQVCSFPRCELLCCQREVKDRCALEVFLRVFLDQHHTLVWVCQRLDAVPDAHDELVCLLHLFDEVLRAHAAVVRVGKHFGRIIQRAAKARAYRQKAAAKSRHQVLACTSCHNGVVRSTHSGTVVRCDHENHLNKLRALLRQLPAEPQQRQNAADAQILAENLGDRHAAIRQLLAAVIRDGRDEVCRLADHAELLGPSVVHRHLRCFALGRLYDNACLDKLSVHLFDHLWQLVEGVGNVKAGLLHCLVFGGGRLHVAPRLRAGVPELHLRREAGRARANAPRNHWLGDAS